MTGQCHQHTAALLKTLRKKDKKFGTVVLNAFISRDLNAHFYQ